MAVGGRPKKILIAVEVLRNREQFDCEHCPWGRHCDTTYEWPGSRGPASHAQWVVTLNGRTQVESRTCLLPMVEPEIAELVQLHGFYRDGLLPFSGGVLEQPAYYLEAMRLVAAAVNDDGR